MKPDQRYLTLFILTLIIIIHAVDRLSIVILLEDIRVDLALSDAQLGFLSGFAFVAVYVIAGIPMAFFSDRSNRSRLIGVALMVMGGMTVLSGYVQNFWQLVATRCGIGVGASPCVPAAHSIIADAFPPSQRTTALSITESGFFVGSFVGLWLCGWIATDHGWRVAFIAVGSIPILLGVLVLVALRDPRRVRDSLSRKVELNFGESLGTVIGVSAVRWYFTGCGLAVFASAAMMTWLPSLMIRSYGMTKTEAGGYIGAINGIGGFMITICVGVIADRLSRRDLLWNLWLPATLFLVSAPFAAFTFLSHSPAFMLLCFGVSASLVTACAAPIISYSQQIMPSSVHAMITAVIFLVLNVVGFGVGPLMVGALSDYLVPHVGETAALQQSLLFLAPPALVLGATCVGVGAWLSSGRKAPLSTS